MLEIKRNFVEDVLEAYHHYWFELDKDVVTVDDIFGYLCRMYPEYDELDDSVFKGIILYEAIDNVLHRKEKPHERCE